MAQSPLALSAAASARLERFGTEAQPLLIVDDCLADPDLVVAIAAKHDFRPMGPFYPGVRAPVSEAVAMPLVLPLLAIIADGFALPKLPAFLECYLSIVTTPPAALTPIQRLPHFDGTERERIAVLLYLDRTQQGGTAFYRQRATGFEFVSEERFARYRDTLERETARTGLPEPAYIDGDTALFERVHSVEGRFNRLVAYHGNTLHCAALGNGFKPLANAKSGRLTLNLFLTA
jgi:hypothetical protein